MGNNIHSSNISSRDPSEDQFIEECIQQYKEKVLGTKLKILIFGPSEPASGSGEYQIKLYKKRVAIKERLVQLGHVSLFSEEIQKEAISTLSGQIPNLEIFERIQIEQADTVIMLRTSPGSLGEFHDFHRVTDCVKKMYVLFDRDHKENYCHGGADQVFATNGGKLDEFSYPDDIDRCNLLNKVEDHIKKLQEAIYISTFQKY